MAMARLRDLGRSDIALVVAAGAEDNPPGSRRFVERIQATGLDTIYNLGYRLSLAETYAALGESDATVYPSLCESFSAAYLMAMERGAPLIAADLDFARMVCGDAAAYFRYDSPDDLAARLIELADNPAARQALVECGRERSKHYTVDRMLGGFLDAIAAAQT
ncbi:MAG: glycosyltransferase [Deltaproteobacteria bacterium]|nr:glycosyltransferase [Deltaproteobacteria bacterium]